MAYLGQQPISGDFKKLDTISVVNGQAAYTMQYNSANYVPASANHMIVSLNGIIQNPGTSFTVSGSTLTFASNLVTGDVINFIMVLGDVLNIGAPSDNTVTNDKLATAPTIISKGAGSDSGAIKLNCENNSHGVTIKGPPHSAAQSYTLTLPSTAPVANKVLQTDGSGNLSFADGGGNAPAFFAHLSASQTLTNNTRNKLQCNTEILDSGGQYDNSSNYRFTPTTAGKYYVFANSDLASAGQGTVNWILNEIFKNGTSSGIRAYGYIDFRNNPANGGNTFAAGVFDMNGSSDYVEFYSYPGLSSGTPSAYGDSSTYNTYFGAFKLGV
tara:strand:+ start:4724 stop:5704 length:981 start_codon:yes stop_codon:yes gene_type:complete